MKTLNETIYFIDQWQQRNTTNWSLLDDALFYLRAFRDAECAVEEEKKRYQEAIKNCEEVENNYRAKLREVERLRSELTNAEIEAIKTDLNEPLTWSELKSFEDKPIWIEEWRRRYGKTEYARWWIVMTWINDEEMGDSQRWQFKKEDMGFSWNAYRKERK